MIAFSKIEQGIQGCVKTALASVTFEINVGHFKILTKVLAALDLYHNDRWYPETPGRIRTYPSNAASGPVKPQDASLTAFKPVKAAQPLHKILPKVPSL
ncbi:hypothetical protein SAMN05428961_103458 [Paenibacillus sp. OK060]|nr:hypothetical protein [Paenibacillus sp. OK060]SDK98105.1 hypothetical protein SAMN05428961_103458 [Paenibacillus sp. OK060]